MNSNVPQNRLTSLADLGKVMKPKTHISKKQFKNPTPSPMLLKADGEDHINVWEGAETILGQFLAHNHRVKFHHNQLGRFDSLEAFWYYIQSEERDDTIRGMSGKTLKDFVNKLQFKRVTNFRAIIMDTHYQRIKQFKPIEEEIRQSTLPFECYYINNQSKLRTRPVFFKWLIQGFEEIRKAIKENRQPNFTFLLDQRNSGIYDFIISGPKVSDSKVDNIDTSVNASSNKESQTPASFVEESSTPVNITSVPIDTRENIGGVDCSVMDNDRIYSN